MAHANKVAQMFVELVTEDGGAFTPMQLIKLTYIAHGASLGYFGVPLISNEIEAWKYGPVIPDLYHDLKRYRDQAVAEVPTLVSMEGLTEKQRQTVKVVYDTYKGFTGYALSEMTHRPGTPWSRVFNDNAYGIPIPNDLIEHHYKNLLQAA